MESLNVGNIKVYHDINTIITEKDNQIIEKIETYGDIHGLYIGSNVLMVLSLWDSNSYPMYDFFDTLTGKYINFEKIY